MSQVKVRYWAAAKDAAGVSEEFISADTLADALRAVQSQRPGNSRFANVISCSSFLIDDEPVGKRDPSTVSLSPGMAIEVLPAFAGG
jgi:molybdopterin synthase sulfur carrier subunit